MKQIETEHGIFTDRVNMQGDVIENAEDYYARWLKDRENKIDICDEPTAEERIAQLEADKEALAQNVYALAEVLEALLGGEEDGQEEHITEDTEG